MEAGDIGLGGELDKISMSMFGTNGGEILSGKEVLGKRGFGRLC